MMHSEMQEIVNAITYRPGWTINFGDDGTPSQIGRPYIQIVCEGPDAIDAFTGEHAPWSGGKHYLSWHMCRQEVVGAVFGAIRAAEEHEMREWFRYRGRAIYNPHLDPDVLADVAVMQNMNLRENAMSMTETDVTD